MLFPREAAQIEKRIEEKKIPVIIAWFQTVKV